MNQTHHDPVVQLIKDLARALVDQPGAVTVNELVGNSVTVLEVGVAKGDVGQLVGRQGRTADAVRQLLYAIGGRNRMRYRFEVLGPCTDTPLALRRDPARLFDTNPAQAARELLHRIIVQLVDEPGAVRVDVLEGTHAVVLEVRVAPADVPRLLGRQGRTVDAARTILQNLGKKSRRTYILEVIEPDDAD